MEAERGMRRALPSASPAAVSSSSESADACLRHRMFVTRRRTAAARQLSTASSMRGPWSALVEFRVSQRPKMSCKQPPS